MKKGLTIGMKETLNITVTSDMFAAFDGEIVHPAYSTASMVKHMEQVSRQLILPYIDEREESAGAQVTMKHMAPTPEGSEIQCVATLSAFDARKVTTEVEVTNAIGIIGRGTVTIAVLPKDYMTKQLEKIQTQLNAEG